MTDVDRRPRGRRGEPSGVRPGATTRPAPVRPPTSSGAGADTGATDDAPRPLAITSLAAAGYAAGVGLAVVVAAVLLGWALSPHGDASLDGALRVGGLVWLAVNRIPVAVGTGAIGVLPWLLLALPLALLYRAGAWAARASRVEGVADAVLLCVAVSAGYGVVAGAVAVWSTTATAAVVPVHALLGGALVALVGCGLGVARAAGLESRLRRRPPAAARPPLRGGIAAAATLVGAAAVIAAVATALALPDAADVARALAPGPVGGVALAVLGVGYAPVAVTWSLAYVVGAGTDVGAGAAVSPFAAHLGDLPALPWLAALPSTAPAAAPALLVLPVVAGVVGGVVLLRSLPDRAAPVVVTDVVAVAAVAGGVAGLLAAMSTGGLGPGRLAVAGPSPLAVGVFAAGLVLVGAAISVTSETAWRHVKRRSGTA